MEVNNKSKRHLFIFLFIFLLAPLLQHEFKFIDSGKLNGAIVSTANPDFSWKGWWEGEYQHNKSAYLNDSTGFRQDFVRLNNQIDYWLFTKLHEDGIVVGKDNCLFGKDYIKIYYGDRNPGDSAIKAELQKLKYVQDTLERMGKHFVFVYAPDKEYQYPDNIPEEYRQNITQPNTYRLFKKAADSIGIHQIDFNQWFVEKKKTSRELMFAKQGLHWTSYGSLLAADSLISYYEKAMHIKMAHIVWSKVKHSYIPEDKDVAKSLNLIFPVMKELFTYPEYSFASDATTTKPKIIYLGDSFLWTFMFNNIIQNTSQDWEFWYYFNDMWNENVSAGKEQLQHKDSYDWKGKLNKSDILVMLYTPTNLSGFSYGFIDQAYEYYHGKK